MIGSQRGIALAAALLLVSAGAAVGQVGSLYGVNTVTLSVTGFDPLGLDLSETFAATYRYERFSIATRSSFALSGLTSQDLRVAFPLGDLSLQGNASFTGVAFSRAGLSVTGSHTGVGYAVTLLLAELGTPQTPSTGAGLTFRASGTIPDVARITVLLGLGATPFGQVIEGCSLCYEGARVSVSDLRICGGTLEVDLTFGQGGLDSQRANWTFPLPWCDLQLRVNLSYVDLFEFTGMIAGVNGTLWGIRTNGNFSFDETYAFMQGSWSLSGPFFGGQLSSSISFDDTDLLSQSISWSRAFDRWSIVVTPTFEILSVVGSTMQFDVPSVRVTLRYDLVCCDEVERAIDLGDLIANLFVTRDGGFEEISITYSMRF